MVKRQGLAMYRTGSDTLDSERRMDGAIAAVRSGRRIPQLLCIPIGFGIAALVYPWVMAPQSRIGGDLMAAPLAALVAFCLGGGVAFALSRLAVRWYTPKLVAKVAMQKKVDSEELASIFQALAKAG